MRRYSYNSLATPEQRIAAGRIIGIADREGKLAALIALRDSDLPDGLYIGHDTELRNVSEEIKSSPRLRT